MSKKKVLIVASGPLLLNHGWHIRTYQLVKHFESIGYIPEIFIIYPKEWAPIPIEWLGITKKFNLRGIVYHSFKLGYLPSFKSFLFLNRIKHEYEYILFRFERLAFNSLFFLLNKKIIIDYDDFIYPLLSKNSVQKLKYFLLLKIADQFSHLIFVLNHQHNKYFSNSIWLPVLPPAMFLENHTSKFKKRYSKNPILIFIGQDPSGVISFIEKYWVEIAKQIPNIEFHLISNNIQNKTKNLNNVSGIKILSNINSLQEIYEKAWAMLFISNHSFGVHVKILESIFFETVVFTLNNSMRGYDFFNYDNSVIQGAENELELYKKIINLLANQHDFLKLSKSAETLLKKEFDFYKMSQKIVQAII